MTRWIGVVVAPSGVSSEGMVSRLPGYLHPVAGRPLVWHTVSMLAGIDPAPERVMVIGGSDLPADLFDEVGGDRVSLIGIDAVGDIDSDSFGDAATAVLVVDASAYVPRESVQRLLESPRGSWLGTDSLVAAARLDPQLAPEVIRLPTPLQRTRGVLTDAGLLGEVDPGVTVRDRVELALVGRRIRDQVVAGHMRAGVTFLLPESVLVDVDVRIGRDTVVYPGVVLEGQTTIGGETVIGPGCRVIDSWIGSGVEMKGWNYVAHTSVRNRAILEPYVRRGFD